MPIFITNTLPAYCSNCGRRLFENFNAYAKEDFSRSCAHTCDCGTSFQYVPGPDIFAAAAKVGDIAGFHTAADFAI